ncbi:PTS sugar transporter subunit IIA [Propionispora vibrioides]|uniref:PTS system, mannose-specific IIA component n=1 Tax=Propionispora vibrioides TaxID=112903 RepID=A0A1H8WU71_9FIRM|nr:PTS mannose transporter subunit IID [Propionispora vibrioides]SEP31181.1 PTS system, mannose-specific IIA component [Propionispora vibrioides]
MVGILIATHGKLAEGLLDAAELIIGKQKKCNILSVLHGDDINAFGKSICQNVLELDDGDGVLLFTDLFSASPANQVALNYPQMKTHKIKAITGVNLPMLLEAIGKRILNEDLDSMTEAAILAAHGGIKDLLAELSKNKAV